MSNKVQIHRFLVVENAAIIIQLTSCDVTCIQRPAVEFFWGCMRELEGKKAKRRVKQTLVVENPQ